MEPKIPRVPERSATRLLSAAICVSAAAAGGCADEPVTFQDRPPAEVGSSFSVGGLALVKPSEGFGYTGPLSPTEQAFRERGKRLDRTVWEGALIGALVGTAIGGVATGDAEGAAGGAIAGAALGALAGMYVAEKQERYASREDQIESVTGDVRAYNRDTEALIADAGILLEEDRRRLAQVQARLARGEATEGELKQQRARAWANREVAEKAARNARDQYRLFDSARQTYEKSDPGAETAALKRELTRYSQTIDTLDSVAASMAKA